MKTFWTEDDSDSIAAEKLCATIGQMANRRFLKQILVFAASITLVIWVAALLFPDEVREAYETVFSASKKLAIVVFGLPFGSGMLLAYTLFRLKFPDIEEQDLDSDMMSSYAFQSHATKRWRVWLTSTAAGVLNVIGLVVTVLWLTP